jgi:hypothetical protein
LVSRIIWNLWSKKVLATLDHLKIVLTTQIVQCSGALVGLKVLETSADENFKGLMLGGVGGAKMG